MSSTVDYTLTRTTAPSSLLTVPEAKTHCRIDGSSEDKYLLELISAATAALDGPKGMVGKALVTQTWTYTRSWLLGKARLAIPVLPFQSVTSLKYYDGDNVQQTADLNDFVVFGNEDTGYIEPISGWPGMYDRPDAIELIFVAGYGAKSAVPATLVHACKLLVGHWYENREQIAMGVTPAEIPMTVEALVNFERTGWVKG